MTSTPQPKDDRALIEASQAGDPTAVEELVRSHQTRVYNFAMRMCRNVEDAKDILQETFLGMLRSIKEFRGESKFTTWLYRIASNACLKKRRRGVFEHAYYHKDGPGRGKYIDNFLAGLHWGRVNDRFKKYCK